MNEQLQQLVQYIRTHLHAGVPEQHIHAALQQVGWPAEWIEHGLAIVRAELAQVAQTAEVALLPPAEPVEQPAQQISQKLRLFPLIAQTWRTIMYNWSTFIVSVLAACGLIILVTVPVSLVVTAVFAASPLAGIIVAVPLGFAASVFGSAFLQSAVSLTIFASHNRLRTTPGEVLSSAWWRMPQAAKALAMQYGLVITPGLLLSLLLVLTAWFDSSIIVMIPVLIFGGALALYFTVIFMLRFALIAPVAIFEQPKNIASLLRRASSLVLPGALWLIAKLLIAVIVLALIGGAINDASQGEDVSRVSGIITNTLGLLALLGGLFLNALITTIYLHRRKAIK